MNFLTNWNIYIYIKTSTNVLDEIICENNPDTSTYI